MDFQKKADASSDVPAYMLSEGVGARCAKLNLRFLLVSSSEAHTMWVIEGIAARDAATLAFEPLIAFQKLFLLVNAMLSNLVRPLLNPYLTC